jgi:Protein of unknown function (DUF4012)
MTSSSESPPWVPLHPPRPAKPSVWKRWRRWLWVPAVVVLLLGADAIYVAAKLNPVIGRVAGAMRAGSDAAGRLDIRTARSEFEAARGDAARAQDLMDHPAVRLASFLPGVGRDVDAVDAAMDAAAIAAASGVRITEVAGRFGDNEEAAAAVFSEGTFSFGPIDALSSVITTGANELERAKRLLDQAPTPSIDTVEDRFEEVRQQMFEASSAARRAATSLQVLPSIMGRTEKRRYLLVFQTPSEARGTGGLIGHYGVLAADEGRVSLELVGPYADLPEVPRGAVTAPRWFAQKYGPTSSLRQWSQANMSAHLPTVAGVLLDMYEVARGQRLDGVIAMDPIALAEMLEGTGPIRTLDDIELNAQNARQVLLHDTYVRFDGEPAAQSAYIGSIIRSFWESATGPEIDVAEFLRGIVDAASTTHLKIVVDDAAARSSLAELGVDGGFTDGPNVQMVFGNNVAANKVDFFLNRTQDTDLVIMGNGDIEVQTTVEVRNEAPTAGPRTLLGPSIVGDIAGLNRMYVNFLLPKSAQVRSFYLDGKRRFPITSEEAGYPTPWEILELAPGEVATFEINYLLQDAVQGEGGRGTFQFTLLPQTTVNADRFSITFTPPPGWSIEAGPGLEDGPQGAISMQGLLERRRTLDVTVTAPER